ncbi:LacI family DNA-binding transcriptional regulator [Acerihabitans arboris]|uniref:LacI family DNA-binding transcriptional regulator n=1 Tax=Acerihabitans arboris TaxID=2691583 RepID=A0A845SP23_9GAMM|nr:LacI family DNA-binding transcriptional regulator [Acerihabitans arboris]NDL64927.1 LacI family DNA-binding transcriptional regulator [Acerihabitans arboris]
MRKVTMRDVSRATGLSMFTVSKALNGGEGVSEESLKMILLAARELGYVPNRAAQELRRSSRDSVAVITADASNSYYLNLMSGIQHTLRPSNWTVVVGDVAVDGVYDPCLEDRMIKRLIESRMAGVISTLTLSPDNIRLLETWDIPIVFVDSAPVGENTYPSVTTDNFNASLLVGDHLAYHGYREWLFLIYPEKWTTRFERERGIREAARRHGAQLVVLESDNDTHSAYAKLGQYLEKTARLPDVLIAGNNPLLLGALKLLQDRRIAIPADMALMGYDEFDWAPLLNPPLTTLNEHSEEIGRRAAGLLVALIGEQTGPDNAAPSSASRREYQQQVPAELIVRQSCGCGLPALPKKKKES